MARISSYCQLNSDDTKASEISLKQYRRFQILIEDYDAILGDFDFNAIEKYCHQNNITYQMDVGFLTTLVFTNKFEDFLKLYDFINGLEVLKKMKN